MAGILGKFVGKAVGSASAEPIEAVGNVIDRVQHGYVVDFIHVHWGDAYFPAFNVADLAISIGAGLILLDALRDWRASRGQVS
jgi:signal peptidase II